MRKLVLTAVFLFVAGAASAASLTENIDRTFDVRAGADVALTNVNGRITVTSWDQPRVRVLAVKKVEADRDEIGKAMKELRVEFQQRDGGLQITTHFPQHDHGIGSLFDWILGDHVEAQVSYEITVPRTMNVDVRNTNGSIRVSDVSGKHELDTTNGRIEVTRCSGSLDASTTNGSIRAELTRVAKGQPMRFETTNGRIEIAVPPDLAVDVDAGTTNGSITTDLPVATTRLGRNSLRGAINGGGTTLRMRTTNGGIAIRTIGKS
jgi:DUF4097 and DUF4098 domain-containing protein YvlB